MKAEDLKTKTPDELKKLLGDLKKQQFNLRFQKSQGTTQNTAQMGAVRRDIARVKTFLGQKAAGATETVAKKAPAKKAPAKKAAKGKSGKEAAA